MKNIGFKLIGLIGLIILVVLIILVWQMDQKINLLSNQVSVLNLSNGNESTAVNDGEKITSTPAATPPKENPVPKNELASPAGGSAVEIPASIIFPAVSSPLLLPQSNLTITIEKFVKSPADDTITLNLKIFTNETFSYSALEISGLFALVDLEKGEMQKPARATGSFNSLPPQSATPGQIIFNLDETSKNIFILKIGADENAKFYELDFNKRMYRETSVG